MRFKRTQLAALADATFAILERTGVKVFESVAADALVAGGCTRAGDTVRIPKAVVASALRSAPRTVTLHDASGKPTIKLNRRKVHFGTGSDTPTVRDIATGERRFAKLADIADAARVVDGLPNIDFAMSMGLASDAPADSADRRHFEAMAANTSKPIVFTATSDASLRRVLESAAAAAVGVEDLRRRPRAALYAMPISPLVHAPEVTPMIRTAAEFSLPLVYASGIIAGATGPATLAGTVAVGAAECLSGLVLHQLARPGAPFIFGVIGSVMDMRTTVSAYGGAEFCMLNALATALGHYLGLAVFGTGGCADAKTLDEQAASEMAFSLFAAHAAGTDLVHDVGYLESGQTASLPGVVLGDEIIRHLRRIEAGVGFDAEGLAIDVIDRVGPGGQYLDNEHTLANFRSEFIIDTRFDRQPFASWQSSGGKTLGERLAEEVRRMLDITGRRTPGKPGR